MSNLTLNLSKAKHRRDEPQLGKERVTIRNVQYKRPQFDSDGSDGPAPMSQGGDEGVDVYPEEMDRETARLIHEF